MWTIHNTDARIYNLYLHLDIYILNKHWIYFFFLIFRHAKIPPSFGIPSYWYYFFTYLLSKCFTFFKFNIQSQKFDIKAALTREKIKRNMLDKKKLP